MSELSLPSLEALQEARQRISGVVRHTPLVPAHERFAAPDVYLKLETLQPVGSFKIRGIHNAVSVLPDAERAKGVSTVSAGNTAQALAWVATRFGVPSRSLMPDTAPKTKIDAVRAYGGEPVLVPVAEVFRFLKEHGWESEPYAFIHPWTNTDVVTGHGSLGLEILEDLPDVDTVFIPVGGGGLLTGVGAALKAQKPELRILAVEPEGCPALHESLKAGRPVNVPCQTLCDGVAVPYITDEMFPRLRALVDATRLVSEERVRAVIRALALDNKLVVEGSGALALAAALAEAPAERGRAVCIVTGGSIDPGKLAAILADESLSNSL
jgi:threonine dehydratase